MDTHSLMRRRLQDFKKATREFLRGQMDGDAFKAIRLPLGVYYQKPETSWMLRVSIRGGRMSSETARSLAECADNNEGVLHFTTRQNVQLHCLALSNIPGLLHHLLDLGVVTYGASGDGIRSIKLPARNGLTEPSSPDLFPLLWKLEEYFVDHPLNMDLPRKFKITVANGMEASREVNLRGEDLGLRRCESGDYRVFAGGGLGARPQKACEFSSSTSMDELFLMTEAALRYFNENGNRTNRSKARMKFLLMNRGEKQFREEILKTYDRMDSEEREDILSRVQSIGDPPREFTVGQEVPDGREESVLPPDDMAVVNQVEPNYHAVRLETSLGDVAAEDFKRIATVTEEYGSGQLRLTCDQNLLLTDVAVADLKDVASEVQTLDTLFLESMGSVDNVCPGSDYCDLGLASSRSLAREIETVLEENGLEDRAEEYTINVSGCQNSCAWYQRADIGLSGGLTKENGDRKEVFSLFRGGEGHHSESFAECVARSVPVDEIPERVVRILQDED